MQILKELIRREIAGDTVLVPVGRSVYEANGLFILNELAAFIWDILPQASSEEEILEKVLAEYDVAPDTARADVTEFLEKLRAMGILAKN